MENFTLENKTSESQSFRFFNVNVEQKLNPGEYVKVTPTSADQEAYYKCIQKEVLTPNNGSQPVPPQPQPQWEYYSRIELASPVSSDNLRPAVVVYKDLNESETGNKAGVVFTNPSAVDTLLIDSDSVCEYVVPHSELGLEALKSYSYDEITEEIINEIFYTIEFIQPTPDPQWQYYSELFIAGTTSSDMMEPRVNIYEDLNSDKTGNTAGIQFINDSNADTLYIKSNELNIDIEILPQSSSAIFSTSNYQYSDIDVATIEGLCETLEFIEEIEEYDEEAYFIDPETGSTSAIFELVCSQEVLDAGFGSVVLYVNNITPNYNICFEDPITQTINIVAPQVYQPYYYSLQQVSISILDDLLQTIADSAYQTPIEPGDGYESWEYVYDDSMNLLASIRLTASQEDLDAGYGVGSVFITNTTIDKVITVTIDGTVYTINPIDNATINVSLNPLDVSVLNQLLIDVKNSVVITDKVWDFDYITYGEDTQQHSIFKVEVCTTQEVLDAGQGAVLFKYQNLTDDQYIEIVSAGGATSSFIPYSASNELLNLSNITSEGLTQQADDVAISVEYEDYIPFSHVFTLQNPYTNGNYGVINANASHETMKAGQGTLFLVIGNDNPNATLTFEIDNVQYEVCNEHRNFEMNLQEIDETIIYNIVASIISTIKVNEVRPTIYDSSINEYYKTAYILDINWGEIIIGSISLMTTDADLQSEQGTIETRARSYSDRLITFTDLNGTSTTVHSYSTAMSSYETSNVTLQLLDQSLIDIIDSITAEPDQTFGWSSDITYNDTAIGNVSCVGTHEAMKAGAGDIITTVVVDEPGYEVQFTYGGTTHIITSEDTYKNTSYFDPVDMSVVTNLTTNTASTVVVTPINNDNIGEV